MEPSRLKSIKYLERFTLVGLRKSMTVAWPRSSWLLLRHTRKNRKKTGREGFSCGRIEIISVPCSMASSLDSRLMDIGLLMANQALMLSSIKSKRRTKESCKRSNSAILCCLKGSPLIASTSPYLHSGCSGMNTKTENRSCLSSSKKRSLGWSRLACRITNTSSELSVSRPGSHPPGR